MTFFPQVTELPTFLAQGATAAHWEFARLQVFDTWWHWFALMLFSAAIVWYVVWMYRRDAEELPRQIAVLLISLRLLAFGGLLFYFFQLERRIDRMFVKPSRVMVLVDTSQSMSLRDMEASTAGSGPSRAEAIVAEFTKGDLLAKLREKHEVVVCRFDQADQPVEIAAFPTTSRAGIMAESTPEAVRRAAAVAECRWLYAIAAVIFLIAISFWVGHLFRKPAPRQTSGEEPQSWWLLAAMATLIGGGVFLAVANLRHLEISPLEVLGFAGPAAEEKKTTTVEIKPLEPTDIAWGEKLQPRGGETRIGSVLRTIIEKERGSSLAGVLLLTDGGQNAGINKNIAINMAKDAMISVYPVGIGSDAKTMNIRVVDIEAPQRIFPDDKFSLTGYVQAHGLERSSLNVELFSADAKGEGELRVDERTVDIGKSGQIAPVKFELKPEEKGIRTYKLRVKPLEREIDKKDNEKSAKVEIIDRKTKVLLLAGGPTREFIFLRNQLYRDRESTVHVHLQTGKPGISQDAHEILYEFPKTTEELFEYDCVVGFDPDWEALDELQIKTLERWVAEKAGGLIVVAGPVYTPQWSARRRGDLRIDTLRALYPVAFYQQGSAALSLGRFGSEQAWPLTFTRDGLSSEFLWLDDDVAKSERAWESFSGVYGYYAVKDPKPGARVLARFSDPETKIDNELPIYMAAHYYGSGRVFFQASGEMWRVRAVEDAYFEQYYTKLIRWVSEGRLLRDSSRGVLLADKERCFVGDEVQVRAVLQDSQYRPLVRDSISAVVIRPDGRRLPLVLRKEKEGTRDGVFSEQLTINAEGDWKVELQHLDQLLTREIRAKVPALETEQPERNDLLLSELAAQTGGEYYVGLETAMNRSGSGRPPVVNLIKPQDQVTVLPGSPDKRFQRQLAGWLMAFLVGVLSLEWLIRRLSKLA